IPSDYEESGVIPICIRKIDDLGRPVYEGWINAVRPIADPLRALARRVIGNIWQVSELADGSVHALSAKHQDRLGTEPSYQIYAHAKRLARDIAVGGRRARTALDVDLKEHVLASI